MSRYDVVLGMAIGRRAQGASPHFGTGDQNVLFSRSIRSVRTKFGMRHQGDSHFLCCAALPKPESDIVWKIRVTHYQAEYAESNIGTFETCLKVNFCWTWRRSLFLEMDAKTSLKV